MQLFSELPFDARLAQFVCLACEDSDELDLAVTIAAILTAPGSIFFMGGDKIAKQNAKKKIGMLAQRFTSDLFFQFQTFRDWLEVGLSVQFSSKAKSQKKCSSCGKSVHIDRGCRGCRVRYANDNSLNNKVLDSIMHTRVNVLKLIDNRKARWATLFRPQATAKRRIPQFRSARSQQEESKADFLGEDVVIAIASCLVKVFPEQIGTLLLPDQPQEGMAMLSADIRARISDTAVAMQSIKSDSRYHSFVALSITQLPSGQYLVDKLHPCMIEQKSQFLCEAAVFPNCGFDVAKQLKQFVMDVSSSAATSSVASSSSALASSSSSVPEWSKWVVLKHENHTIRVLSDIRFISQVNQILQSKHDEVFVMAFLIDLLRDSFLQIKRQMLEYDKEETLVGGMGVVKVVAGSSIANFEPVGISRRLTLRKIPVDSNDHDALKTWVSEKLNVDLHDKKVIKWFSITPQQSQPVYSSEADLEADLDFSLLILVFASENVAKDAIQFAQINQGPIVGFEEEKDEIKNDALELEPSEARSRALNFSYKQGFLSAEQVMDLFTKRFCIERVVIPIGVKLLHKIEAEHELVVKNWPSTYTLERLEDFMNSIGLPEFGGSRAAYIHEPKPVGNPATILRLGFSRLEQRDSVADALEPALPIEIPPFPISSNGSFITISPRLECAIKSGSCIYQVSLRLSFSATKYYYAFSGHL